MIIPTPKLATDRVNFMGPSDETIKTRVPSYIYIECDTLKTPPPVQYHHYAPSTGLDLYGGDISI